MSKPDRTKYFARPKVGTYVGVYGQREPRDYQVQIEWLEGQLSEVQAAWDAQQDERTALYALVEEARRLLEILFTQDLDGSCAADASILARKIDRFHGGTLPTDHPTKAYRGDPRFSCVYCCDTGCKYCCTGKQPKDGDLIVGDMAYDE